MNRMQIAGDLMVLGTLAVVIGALLAVASYDDSTGDGGDDGDV